MKLCGTTVHFIRENSLESNGGVFYFIYDGAMSKLLQHAAAINNGNNSIRVIIDEQALRGAYYY